ncbi:helix-turn-helix transcriptional regulator [Candidatus Saccharibacteria bacterium]|nr:helix-turn-helix transcriptional regulator [Candidatus Saccharibacteria bacterium]
MDLRKIGKFIASSRAEKGYTQETLAEALDLSNRSISKWERGVCLPDSAHMIRLCELLNISINDLFNGERINMKDSKEISERQLLELAKLKEEKDRQLLKLEWVVGYVSTVSFLVSMFVVAYVEMDTWVRVLLIATGSVSFIVGGHHALKIEQTAGYYKCEKCGNKYIPKYKSVFLAKHMGRTRKMTCPKCGEKSWQKKVL